MSVRETVKSLFRSSKTVDNMSSNGNNSPRNSSIGICHRSRTKSSSPLINNQLSHSQPIVTESLINENNIHFDSTFTNHSEQTPLIDRHDQIKQINPMNDDNNNRRLNRHGLHLPLDIDGLQRSRSCTDEIIIPITNHENNSSSSVAVPTISTTGHSTLQPNQTDVISLHSSDSAASSISAYAPQQQLQLSQCLTQLSAPTALTTNGRND